MQKISLHGWYRRQRKQNSGISRAQCTNPAYSLDEEYEAREP